VETANYTENHRLPLLERAECLQLCPPRSILIQHFHTTDKKSGFSQQILSEIIFITRSH